MTLPLMVHLPWYGVSEAIGKMRPSGCSSVLVTSATGVCFAAVGPCFSSAGCVSIGARDAAVVRLAKKESITTCEWLFESLWFTDLASHLTA